MRVSFPATGEQTLIVSDATITVLSQNGTLDLKDHDIRLLYSRRDNDRIVARIVSEREGVIKAQVEPSRDGKDQAEAFLALRRHVEIKLDYILKDVPGASDRFRDDDDDGSNTVAGPSRSAHTPATSPPMSPSREIARRPLQLETQNQGRNITSPIEAPPAYGKAVKEWRTDEKSG